MDRSLFGSALDGSDLGGNEVQAVRMSSWLAPQRPEDIRRRENRSSSSNGNRMGLGRIRRPVPPGKPSPTAEAGRVIVFSERTFRFVVCRFLVRGIARQSFCGGWR
jgi:hypothetical protein